MQHITYGSSEQYPVAILVKHFLVNSQQAKIKQHYVDPLVAKGIDINDIIVIGLPYTDFKKASAATMNESIPELQEFMDKCGCLDVLVADTPYLKKLCKKQKIVNLAGVRLPSVFGSQNLFKARLYATYVYNNKAAERVNMGMDALVESHMGTYTEKDILKTALYPYEPEDIKTALNGLLTHNVLAVDIEGFGLRLNDAGVATIAFSWSVDSGIAFGVDYREDFQEPKPNWEIRTLLLEFLLEYCDQGGVTIYHGIAYDVKQLVANLFMRNDLLNYPAMVDGVRTLTENAFCTKDISYLATNSAAGNTLGLKHLALEYTGNYAIDVTSIRQHSLADVLKYNLIDTCATFWLYEKNYPIMVSRNQEELYLTHYQRNQRTLITMELTGMPLDMDEVIRLRLELDTKEQELLKTLRNLPAVKAWEEFKASVMHTKYQASVKGDGRTLENYTSWQMEKGEIQFKPTQDKALVWILHEHYELEIIDKTAKERIASVADDTLEKHVQWVTNNPTPDTPDILDFLRDVREYNQIVKINGTFVKALITKSIRKKDGVYYLHGSFNQGGTLSGRLSSSDPNLQNLPSGGYWGKAIKRCFKPPPGKVMLGSDYNALEARVAALLTKDPNMLKVYTDGFDSHSLNTHAYADGTETWYSQITNPLDPASINQIIDIAPDDRRASKPTTFALQFFGDHKTLMNNQGYSEKKSVRLVQAFKTLYVKYFEFIDKVLDQGMEDGFITLAYGLRIDAPACAKSIANTSVTPSTVAAERRSLGNAKCQSFGCVNTFAADDFMRRVWASEWKYQIHPMALIHDAIYLFAPQDLNCIKWINENLIECMASQTHPDIFHVDVKLEAELDVHYPTWAEACTLPNNAAMDEIIKHIKQLVEKADDKQHSTV